MLVYKELFRHSHAFRNMRRAEGLGGRSRPPPPHTHTVGASVNWATSANCVLVVSPLAVILNPEKVVFTTMQRGLSMTP